ncbi:hypothetical protein F4803DRAFT_556505 [Xylaria telfairii]|nr:hypothetical protein F4803DRAFT_556505 [Xylaria telfairii]
MRGMKVVRSTRSAEKVGYVTTELGFDAAWNYKVEKTVDALARPAPDGLDYYDNIACKRLGIFDFL